VGERIETSSLTLTLVTGNPNQWTTSRPWKKRGHVTWPPF